MEAVSRRDRKSRGPFVNAGASVFIVLLIAVVALNPTNQPPPAIAELAPQPQKQIVEAPQEQSSQFGKGSGGGECVGPDCPGVETTTTLPPVTVPQKIIERARVRRCVGNPPRQTEDPQSPPCVPYWEGNNGGATTKGVTANEIRIVVPDSGDEDLVLQTYFNARYEFYGRKLVLIPGRDDHGATPAEETAAAVAADEQRQAFASTDATYPSKLHYVEELARRKIIFAAVDTDATEAFMVSRHPYVWQYTVGIDTLQRTLGAWACSRLVGKPPKDTGNATPLGAGGNRTFGVIVQDETVDRPVDLSPLANSLAACGAKLDDEERSTVGDKGGASNSILRLKSKNISTVFCLCLHSDAYNLYIQATGQAYRPEWVQTTYGRMDRNFSFHTFPYPKEHLANAFGLSFIPRQILPSEEPMQWAMAESKGGAQGKGLDLSIWNVNVKYRALLMLASGIQMAGPNLTPQTFAAGLQKTRFPNPDHRNLPGKVGFDEPDHSMTLDYTEWFWSNDASGPYDEEGQGTVCYIDNGVRTPVRAVPSGPDKFFQAPCHAGTALSVPARPR